MREYTFTVKFGLTYGDFDVEATDINEAYDKAFEEISKALIDLPVEVEFDVECIEAPDEDEEEDEDDE